MAKCKICGKSGWLLSVDNNGMCKVCSEIHLPTVVNLCRIVVESGQIIGKTKAIATKLSRAETAKRCCAELLPYEKAGIPTLTEDPSLLIREFERLRVEAIEQYLHDLLYAAEEKRIDAKTDHGKLSGYNQAISKLDKLMEGIEDVSELEQAKDSLRVKRDAIAAELKEQKAEVLAAQGKQKRAIEVLIEALFLLAHDGTDDLRQAQEFDRIKGRIVALGGEVPTRFT